MFELNFYNGPPLFGGFFYLIKFKSKTGGEILKVFFGSIEYFEEEMLSFAKRKSFMELSTNQIMEIQSEIKDELINDFVCDVDIKRECINNLNLAAERLLCKYQCV